MTENRLRQKVSEFPKFSITMWFPEIKTIFCSTKFGPREIGLELKIDYTVFYIKNCILIPDIVYDQIEGKNKIILIAIYESFDWQMLDVLPMSPTVMHRVKSRQMSIDLWSAAEYFS